MEQWAAVGIAPGYEVSNQGRVRNAKGYVFAPHVMDNGYCTANLIIEKKQKVSLIHRLVAAAFIPNPEEKPHVNHIDGDRTNNRVENLEWVTPKENMAKATRPRGQRRRGVIQVTLDGKSLIKRWETAAGAARALGLRGNHITRCCRGEIHTVKGTNWVYEDHWDDAPAGEEWREVKTQDRTWKVSSLGRVKTKTGANTYGGLSGSYRIVGGTTRVHRLVAEAFCPKKDGADVVNHIDGNPSNNVASNLEWVTRSENSQHAIRTGLRKGRIFPVQYTAEDRTIKSYQSIRAAAAATGIPVGRLTDVCHAGTAGWALAAKNMQPGAVIEVTTDPEMDALIDELLAM